MATMSKKEFAEVCAIKTKDLSIYIKRGHVVVNVDDQIDTYVEKNRLFLQNRRAKMDIALSDPEIAANTPAASARMRKILSDNPDDDEDEEGREDLTPGKILSMTASEKRYKHFLAVKTERAAELDRLKISKAKGEVVPSELIIPIFLQHNQSLISAMKNAGEELLRQFGKKKALSGAEQAELRGFLTKAINTAINNATKASTAAVANVISQHTERRGVGERA